MTIKWFKNGCEIDVKSPNYSASFDESTGKSSLEIRKCDLNETALFSCRVSNALGMAESSAFLKVKEAKVPTGSPPQIIQALESAHIHANTDYTLECIMTGEPEPKITWFKDDVEIIEPSASYTITKFVNLRQLTIKNAQVDKHSGKYTCKAQNDYGSADCSCIIVVKRKIANQYINLN